MELKFGQLDPLDNRNYQHFELNQHSSHLSEGNRELIHRWQQLATWYFLLSAVMSHAFEFL